MGFKYVSTVTLKWKAKHEGTSIRRSLAIEQGPLNSSFPLLGRFASERANQVRFKYSKKRRIRICIRIRTTRTEVGLGD